MSAVGAAEAAVRAYADALARGDLDEGVSFVHSPAMYITPLAVAVFPDADVARVGLSIGMEQMQVEGYHHTEFFGVTSRPLSPDLVAVSGTLARMSTDGRELNRVGFTYTLRMQEGRWRIVCGIIRDLPA